MSSLALVWEWPSSISAVGVSGRHFVEVELNIPGGARRRLGVRGSVLAVGLGVAEFHLGGFVFQAGILSRWNSEFPENLVILAKAGIQAVFQLIH